MKPGYSSNIYCLYLIKLSKWLMLIMPIVALFYNENGLEAFDIYLLQAIYSVSVAILEIPSGYMADILGRKKTLILGSILGTLGFLIYSCSSGFSGFLVAEIILGLGGSFISGADSAMLFDSLAAMRQKHKYFQYEGRITSLGSFAETLAAICGGLIAAFASYRMVYIFQTSIAALAIPAAFYLVEPLRKNAIQQPGITHILKVCKNTLFVNRKLSSTILFSSITGVCTLCMAWSAQIYFVNIGFTEVTITPLWVVLNLSAALTAAFAIKFQQTLGPRLALFLIIIYIPGTYLLLGCMPVLPALISLLFFYSVRGYATPMLKDLINQNCESNIRATVLSIRNLIIRFGFALLGPMIGLFTELTTLSTAFILAGTTLLVLSAASAYRLFTYLPDVFHKKHATQ